MKLPRPWVAATLATVLTATGITAAPAAAVTAAPKHVSYVAIPHPDDEWQTWALVENSTSNYKVFVLMTRGEQTGYCQPRWTAECAGSRVQSFLDYLDRMGAADPSIPAGFTYQGVRGPFADQGRKLERADGGAPFSAPRTAEVWTAGNGMGAVVAFDLGDGDLTEAEAVWAIATTRDNRAALGIDATLPNWNLLGAYYNRSYRGCFVYAHPDHYAVHRALYHTDFGFAYQAAATCGSDPDAKRKQAVTDPSAGASWTAGGAFPDSYGWLGSYRLSDDQRELFHKRQAYWIRFL